MNRKVMKLASSGKRLGAYCIDRVIPFILFWIAVKIALGFIPQQSMDPFGFSFGFGFGYGMGVSPVVSIFKFISVLLVFAAYLVVQIIFYTRSQTIGKAILGLQVINSDDGNPANFWKMILREWFAKKASAAVFMLGFIWVLIDDKNRGWHDKMVDTYVIDIRESASVNNTEDTMETVSEINVEPTTDTDFEMNVESVTEATSEVNEEPIVTVVEETDIETVSNKVTEGGEISG